MNLTPPKTEIDAALASAAAAVQQLAPEQQTQLRKHETVVAAVRNRIAGAEAEVAKQKGDLVGDLEVINRHAQLLHNLETQKRYLADFIAHFDAHFGAGSLATALESCGRRLGAPSDLPNALTTLAQVLAAQSQRDAILEAARNSGPAQAQVAVDDYVAQHGETLREYRIIA